MDNKRKAVRGKTKGSTVLTRAARKKAGLSPPTPFLKRVPKLKTKTKDESTPQAKNSLLTQRHSQTQQPSRSVSHGKLAATAGTDSVSDNDSYSSSSDDNEGKPLWVQCDVMSCRKWRRWPQGVELDHSKKWFCKMHPDSAYQSCDIPEEKWGMPKRRAFTFNKLNSGQLVWAKMKGFSPWPAVVSPDPWSKNAYISAEKEGCIYHVEFLGKTRSHIWLPEEKVEPYHCSTSCQLDKLPQRFNKTFEVALAEAEEHLSLTHEERLTRCIYKEDFVQKTCVSCLGNSSNKASRGRCSGNRVGRPSKRQIQASLKVKSEPNGEDEKVASHRNTLQIPQQHTTSSKHQSLCSNLFATSTRNVSNQPCTPCTKEDTGLSDVASQANLFKTLGIGDNLINILANSYAQQLQSQLTAALQNCVERQTNKVPLSQPTDKLKPTQTLPSAPTPVGNVLVQSGDQHVHKIQTKSNPLAIMPASKPFLLHEPAQMPLHHSNKNNQMVPNTATTSATVGGPKRLTQSSLEVCNGASRSVILTTSRCTPPGRQGRGRKKRDASRVATNQVGKRRRSPRSDDMARKRTRRGKKSLSPSQTKSPTITDYFKSTDTSPVSENMDSNTEIVDTARVSADKVGTRDISSQDQCVPDYLEWEIQNELQEIEDMLSTFESTPASQSSLSGEPMKDDGTFLAPSGPSLSSNGHSLTISGQTLPANCEQMSTGASFQCVMDKNETDDSTKQTEEQNLESVMTELHTIEDLIQDLSNSQVVPYK